MSNSNSINGKLQCFSLTGLDGKTTGSTLIFTPTSRFTPLMVTFEATAITALISVSSCSIGSNGASYNDILAISPLTGVIVVNNVLSFPLSALSNSIAAGTGIYINVTTGAVGTTYTIKSTLTGFYD